MDTEPTLRDTERPERLLKLVYISHVFMGIPSNLDACERIIVELSQRYNAIFLAPWIHCCRHIPDSPENRKRGFELDCACVAICDEFWMVGNQSKGMLIEREAANKAGVTIREFSLDDLGKLLSGEYKLLDAALREALEENCDIT